MYHKSTVLKPLIDSTPELSIVMRRDVGRAVLPSELPRLYVSLSGRLDLGAGDDHVATLGENVPPDGLRTSIRDSTVYNLDVVVCCSALDRQRFKKALVCKRGGRDSVVIAGKGAT